jgi:DNA-binding NarL/FixJ family response regulator
MEKTARVLIIEHIPLLSEAMRSLVEGQARMTVVGTLPSGDAVLAIARETSASIVMLDVAAMADRVLSLTASLRGQRPPISVVLMATEPTGREIYDGFVAGAAAYLSKEAARDELSVALQRVHAGDMALAPAFGLRLAQFVQRCAAGSPRALSRREHQILRLLSKGMTAHSMALCLHVSESTIKSHLFNVYRKLEVRNAAAAVAVAIEQSLL